MRTEQTTIDDFLRSDEQTTVIRITQCFRQSGQSGLQRLAQLATAQKLTFECQKGFQELSNWYLPWYKPNSQGNSGWQYTGSENYTVAEYTDYVCQGNIRPQDQDGVTRIRELKQKLKVGLRKDVVLVAAFDTGLQKRVIVDGCKRVVALAWIANESHTTFLKLLASSYRVVVRQLSSQWAHSLYPCDFIPFLEKSNPNAVARERTEWRDAAINELKTALESH